MTVKNRTKKNAGYTIVEVMIFLAVSGILAVSALQLVGGQQAKTEFDQAVRDLELRIQDLINDVNDGYSLSGEGLACNGTGTAPVITTSATTEQGTNPECIIVGQFIGFTEDNGRQLRIYPAVGLRLASGSGLEVTSVAESNPIIIGPTTTNPSIPDRTQVEFVLNGAKVSTLTYNNGSGNVQVGAFGILTDFATQESGNIVASSRNANLYPLQNTTLTDTPVQISTRVSDMQTAEWNSMVVNPSGGLTICLDSTARTNQHATITIGNTDKRLTTNLQYGAGDCADAFN